MDIEKLVKYVKRVGYKLGIKVVMKNTCQNTTYTYVQILH